MYDGNHDSSRLSARNRLNYSILYGLKLGSLRVALLMLLSRESASDRCG